MSENRKWTLKEQDEKELFESWMQLELITAQLQKLAAKKKHLKDKCWCQIQDAVGEYDLNLNLNTEKMKEGILEVQELSSTDSMGSFLDMFKGFEGR